jgi:hypothetical protein
VWPAGTHAQGTTLGAAVHLVENLSDLYKDLKTRRFSLIIECTADPDNALKITDTRAVTPLYRHDGT